MSRPGQCWDDVKRTAEQTDAYRILCDFINLVFHPIRECATYQDPGAVDRISEALRHKVGLTYLANAQSPNEIKFGLLQAVRYLKGLEPLNPSKFSPYPQLVKYGPKGIGESAHRKWRGAIQDVYPIDLVEERIQEAKMVFDEDRCCLDRDRQTAFRDNNYPPQPAVGYVSYLMADAQVEQSLSTGVAWVDAVLAELSSYHHPFASPPHHISRFGRSLDKHRKDCLLQLDEWKRATAENDEKVLTGVRAKCAQNAQQRCQLKRDLKVFFGKAVD